MLLNKHKTEKMRLEYSIMINYEENSEAFNFLIFEFFMNQSLQENWSFSTSFSVDEFPKDFLQKVFKYIDKTNDRVTVTDLKPEIFEYLEASQCFKKDYWEFYEFVREAPKIIKNNEFEFLTTPQQKNYSSFIKEDAKIAIPEENGLISNLVKEAQESEYGLSFLSIPRIVMNQKSIQWLLNFFSSYFRSVRIDYFEANQEKYITLLVFSIA